MILLERITTAIGIMSIITTLGNDLVNHEYNNVVLHSSLLRRLAVIVLLCRCVMMYGLENTYRHQ